MLCWNINQLLDVSLCVKKRIHAEIYLFHAEWVGEINSYVQI